jgi:hypothetical protein
MELRNDVDSDADLRGFAGLGGGEPRCGHYTGTKALMLAVLENAFACYFSPQVRVRTEAERWVASERKWSPFSFTIVCETLGLEPDAVRTALRRLRTSHAGTGPVIKRVRPNVRQNPSLRGTPPPSQLQRAPEPLAPALLASTEQVE